MRNSEEIWKELAAISPLLAGLEKVNVFRVPQGYFDGLESRITDYVLAGDSSTVQNIDKTNIHEVPAGYFEGLSDSIMTKIRATYPENFQEEEEKIPSLLHGLRNINPFVTPENYFDSLGETILARAKSNATVDEEQPEISPLLQSLKQVNIFSVPVNYFETLSDSIAGKLALDDPETAEQEIRRISPLLYSIQDANVFTVPYGYFSSLAENIIKKVQPAPAKVIQMHSKRSWVRYAVAAAITGLIAFGSVRLFNAHQHNMPVVAADLSNAIKESKQYKTQADIDNAIAKLDDADIAKYLEKSGGIMDNDLLMNNGDESDLPDPNDYLISDSTLNIYLDKINMNTN
ncbi:MAG TPA: hypothetical protein VG847_03305 [Chitinophagaceae bacterium]|nr:hypothetical protein [Chitinophagaceae bacterium]